MWTSRRKSSPSSVTKPHFYDSISFNFNFSNHFAFWHSWSTQQNSSSLLSDIALNVERECNGCTRSMKQKKLGWFHEPIEKSPEQVPTWKLLMNYSRQLLLTVCSRFCVKTIHLNIIFPASHILNLFCFCQNILECVIKSIRTDRGGVHLPSSKPQIRVND